jgi:hypothetical protein
MKIKKQYRTWQNSYDFEDLNYGVTITIEEETDKPLSIFTRDIEKLYEKGSIWIDADKFLNKEELEKYSIDYLIEKDTEAIIPIGIIKFDDTYITLNKLNIKSVNKDKMYLINNIISNIEKAIKIKYEAYIFRTKCFQKIKDETDI